MVGVILSDEYDYSGLEDQCNMTDYELWKVNLIPGLMVMNMSDHNSLLTWYWVIILTWLWIWNNPNSCRCSFDSYVDAWL